MLVSVPHHVRAWQLFECQAASSGVYLGSSAPLPRVCAEFSFLPPQDDLSGGKLAD